MGDLFQIKAKFSDRILIPDRAVPRGLRDGDYVLTLDGVKCMAHFLSTWDNGGGRYTLQYNGKQITLNQQGYNPTTNIPIPRWITPSKARTLFWGEYGPSLGQGNIFAVMVQIPENPLTENVKVIYYLQTEDD